MELAAETAGLRSPAISCLTQQLILFIYSSLSYIFINIYEIKTAVKLKSSEFVASKSCTKAACEVEPTGL